MKYGTLGILVATLMLAGCVTTQKSYQTSTTVSSAGDHRYAVGVTIQATSEDGEKDVLTTPKITVPAGAAGQITIGDEKEEDGVFCTVLVEEKASGLETLTTIIVKEGGRAVLNTTQKTFVEN